MVNKTEISIISRDTIKPSLDSSSLHHVSPFKLSIVDQITPATYMPLILFYPISNPESSFNLPETLTRLKSSLSETLTLYYPFSGRAKNNIYIHDFDTGIPFIEAQVNCGMLEFLKHHETELLNRFVPLHPLCKETGDDSLLPMIAFQVNVFACGGIAIGGSASHKLCDGLAANSILESWAAIFRGKRAKIIHPNFSQASLVFPPRALLPKKYLDLADSFWFKENNYVTRRFVFSVKAIATLQEKSRSKCVPKPSRIEVLTCFIWKHAMASSRALSPGTSPRTSIVAHAMNMRSRMKPQMSSANIIGNFFWWATTVADSSKLEEARELCDLVNQINESLKGFDRDYFESLQGEEGFGAISEYFNQLEVLLSSKAPPEVYLFTSWTTFFHKLDFGWGKPFWVGLMGKAGPAFRNFTVFMESQWGEGIEAWVTLEEKQMDVLERDPEFLAFASPNPGISSM